MFFDHLGYYTENTKAIVKSCLNKDSYKLLCKIPVLLPLLWVHGSADDDAQTYPLTSTGEIDIDEYKLKDALETEFETDILGED